MTRNDRRACSSDEPGNARSKATDLAGTRPSAFRKQDQYVARIVQKLAAHVETGATVMTINGQAVYGNHRQHAAKRCREKVVRGGDREGTVHMCQGKAGEETHRVKVARVIGYHDERPIERQVFLPGYLESMEGPQRSSDRQLYAAAKQRYPDSVKTRESLGGR